MAADSNYVYWDSCIFIDGLRQTIDRFAQIGAIESDAKAGKLYIFASSLAIAEVVKLREYGDLSDEQSHKISVYFHHKFIRIIPVDRVIARTAAEVARELSSIKPPDAIHNATAIRCRCSVMYTYDDSLLKKNGLAGSPSLAIKRPGEWGQSELFPGQH